MSGERILVVDDEAEIGDLLNLYLTKEGYEVTTALDGRQAMDIVANNKIDLIILDVLLPGLDGIELCTEIRKVTDVPIVFLSCRGDDIDKVMGLVAGGDDYITKPFSPRDSRPRKGTPPPLPDDRCCKRRAAKRAQVQGT